MEKRELTLVFNKSGDILSYKLNGKEMRTGKPHTRIQKLHGVSHIAIVHHTVNGKICTCIPMPKGKWKTA